MQKAQREALVLKQTSPLLLLLQNPLHHVFLASRLDKPAAVTNSDSRKFSSTRWDLPQPALDWRCSTRSSCKQRSQGGSDVPQSMALQKRGFWDADKAPGISISPKG